MKNKKRFLAILLCLVMVFSLAACGGQDTSSTESNDPVEQTEPTEPVYGGKITVAISNMFASMGYAPQITNNAALQLAWCSYESLMTTDENGNYVPCLATSWETNPEEPSITYHLREGVTFSDGEPFNAAAVQRNLEEYASIGRSEVANIASYEIVDEYTIKLHLKEWSASDCNIIGFWVLYTSPKALDNPDSIQDQSAGTGPFQIKDVEAGVKISYEKNENYWQEGKPYLDEIEFVLIQDASAMNSSFQSGNVTAAMATVFTQVDTIKNACAAMISAGDVIEEVNSNGVVAVARGILFNSASEDSPFHDINVRRAVLWALDEESINKAVFQGSQPYSDQFALPGTRGYNSDITTIGYDVEKAKALLAEAGYPDGFETEIYGANSDATLMAAISKQLEAVGIQATINAVDSSAFNATMASGAFSGMMIFPHQYGNMALYLSRIFGDTPSLYQAAIGESSDIVAQLEAINASTSDEEQIAQEEKMNEMLFDSETGEILWDEVTVMAPSFFKTSKLHDDKALLNSQWRVVWEDAWLEQ